MGALTMPYPMAPWGGKLQKLDPDEILMKVKTYENSISFCVFQCIGVQVAATQLR